MAAEQGKQPKPLKGFTHIKRYWDKTHGQYAAKILPGEFYVTTHDEMIVTVLGSCISACVRDKVFGIGGMNHFMLPMGDNQAPKDPASKWSSEATRYGNFAMEALINEVLKNGGRRENLEFKVFGGGRILESTTDVGDKNIQFVRDFIRTEGLKLIAEDLGDIYPRKVHYFPVTGKVKMKKLRALHNNTVVEREKRYIDSLQSAPIAGEIDLF
ncbi:MAG TPA: chemoreceptor glutamine deamidase CheD [Candidatus Tenderia sp.]|nr:chemoreceptor glutamine deamidase CheD [Candidatus Tenderia sp.]